MERPVPPDPPPVREPATPAGFSGSLRRALTTGLLAVLAAVVLVPCGVAAADTVRTNFEASTFHLGSVNGQDGWKSAPPGTVTGVPHGFDQEVVANTSAPAEFGAQSFRFSNAYATTVFEGQTRSSTTTEAAGESLANTEYIAQFSFISTDPTAVQPGLAMSISPDNDHTGARMSYIGLRDTAEGINVSFFDTPTPSGEFTAYDLGTLPRDRPHTIKLWLKLIPGPDNDFARVAIDGHDVGECFTTWENYYRAQSESPPNVNQLEFRSGGSGEIPGLLGGGFLFDNLRITTAPGSAPEAGPPTCELPIEKEAEERTVRPGGLVHYRITVHNHGSLAARNLLICDRIPRETRFVGADRKLLRLGDRRCLLVPRLAPGGQATFHPVLRVDSSAPPGSLDNVVEELPGVELAGGEAPGGEPPGVKHPGYLPKPPPSSLPAGAKTAPVPPAAEAKASVAVVRKSPPAPPVTG